MKESTRWLAMLLVFLLGVIPGMFVYNELAIAYDGLWDMWAEYSFQKEMFVRGHIFKGLLWAIPLMVLLEIFCRVGSTPEERRRAKEQRQRELNEQARECVRLKPAPRILERR